jgi:hypothetical protein
MITVNFAALPASPIKSELFDRKKNNLTAGSII